MANTTITITALPTASGIDAAVDWIAIDRTSLATTQKINRNTYLGISGSPVGTSDSQALTNKTIGNTNTVTLKDTLFTLQDDGDTTKQAKFQLSGITTATTRTYTLPNATGTLADIASAQTFTNKTLTSPVISGGSIDNSTITVDAITGHTASTTGTIYGLSIATGKVGNNGVVTASITDSAVTYAKVAAGFPVQVVYSITPSATTGTTVIPIDNTIPQNTEGDQYLSVSITPKSATNILVIDTVLYIQSSVANNLALALFQDATANALAADLTYQASATGGVSIPLRHVMVAGTTSSTTFKLRAGGGSAGTTTINSLFSTAGRSSIVITEYKA